MKNFKLIYVLFIALIVSCSTDDITREDSQITKLGTGFGGGNENTESFLSLDPNEDGITVNIQSRLSSNSNNCPRTYTLTAQRSVLYLDSSRNPELRVEVRTNNGTGGLNSILGTVTIPEGSFSGSITVPQATVTAATPGTVPVQFSVNALFVQEVLADTENIYEFDSTSSTRFCPL